MKVLFLVPAPGNISPGQRFRFEHYIGLDHGENLEFIVKPFFSRKTWSIIHLPGHFIQKSLGVLYGFFKRFFVLFTLHKYAYIYIYREASVIGPPVFEWLIARVFKKKIIYDFDDAIWVSMASDANPGAAAIKCAWKVGLICQLSHIITVGNEFLETYARQFCGDVRIIPTVVDTNSQHNRLKKHDDLPLYVGWTGTFTNFNNLKKITGVIKDLKRKHDFTFFIIADKDPAFTGLEYIYKKWDVKTEIDDLLKLHIGLMPLDNSAIEMGKCGFKAIQYMSLGIPAIVSPVGANLQVVSDGLTGFFANDDKDWYNAIEKLLTNPKLRTELGVNARTKIVDKYSVDATRQDFFDLFKEKQFSK